MERGSKRKRLRAPSPAMVVACIALAVTLSGASYAATTLAKNSVGSNQLKANSVNGSKVANNSLTGADINEATLDLGLAAGGSDAYTVGGGSWIDRDSANRTAVELSNGGENTWCTSPGSTTTGLPAAFADVHLPQGAKFTKMTIDYRDDAGSSLSNGTAELTRMPLFTSGGTDETIFNITLGNIGSGSFVTSVDNTPAELAPSAATVDNTKYAYQIQLFSTQGLEGVVYCSASIEYDLP